MIENDRQLLAFLAFTGSFLSTASARMLWFSFSITDPAQQHAISVAVYGLVFKMFSFLISSMIYCHSSNGR